MSEEKKKHKLLVIGTYNRNPFKKVTIELAFRLNEEDMQDDNITYKVEKS